MPSPVIVLVLSALWYVLPGMAVFHFQILCYPDQQVCFCDVAFCIYASKMLVGAMMGQQFGLCIWKKKWTQCIIHYGAGWAVAVCLTLSMQLCSDLGTHRCENKPQLQMFHQSLFLMEHCHTVSLTLRSSFYWRCDWMKRPGVTSVDM